MNRTAFLALGLLAVLPLAAAGHAHAGSQAKGVWECEHYSPNSSIGLARVVCPPNGRGRAPDDYYTWMVGTPHLGLGACYFLREDLEECQGTLAIVFGWNIQTYAFGAVLTCPDGSVARHGECLRPDDFAVDQTCNLSAGNPVDILTGRKHEDEEDWSSAGAFPLRIERHYSSQHNVLAAPRASRLGTGWRTGFDAAAGWNSTDPRTATLVNTVLPNGFEYSFLRQGDAWRPVLPRLVGRDVLFDRLRSDIDVSLAVDANGVVLRVQDGTQYRFNATGQLAEIRSLGGYVQTLTWADGLNTRVADNLGRWVEFGYGGSNLPGFLMTSAQTSDGRRFAYSYENRFMIDRPYAGTATSNDFWSLKSVTYPDATPDNAADNPKRVYSYLADPDRPFLLTGLTDERGIAYAKWTYDADGRATSSEHAGGTDRWQFAYDDAAGKVTVTNPLGRATVYSYVRQPGGIRQLVAVDGIATTNCAASNTRYTYDARGFRIRATDAEGRVTTWIRDPRGLPLTETEGAGTAAPRSRSFTWDATRPLPLTITEPGRTTSYGYDDQGRLLRVTETDTTTQAVPYATAGQTRTTTYSYAPAAGSDPSAPLPLGPVAVDGPLPGPADTLRYGYDAAGNVTTVTNPLGQVTRITQRDAGGRPLSVTDPNGIVTTMAYDARGRLTTVTVNPGLSQARTTIGYDASGLVTRIVAPDVSFLSYSWDAARRLTSVSNTVGERIDYGYDAAGNVTSRTVKSSDGSILRRQTAVFDELGRLLRSIGAAGQATQYAYDRTGNLLQEKDPRGGTIAYGYDALQRLIRTTDATGASVSLTRNGQDDVTAYQDPRGVTTAYVRNGFGEVIQESGPDVGKTVITRDARGLATTITDPRGIVSNLAYDAAARLLSVSYPSAPAQRVAYVYDGTANGSKGVGRLTGIADGSGSLTRSYDALGRVTSETRVIGTRSYVTAYGYTAAGLLASVTYPSGRVVSYARGLAGQITGVATRASATAPVQTVASAIRSNPMSQQLAGLSFGNGLTETRSHDGDGRIVTLQLSDGAKPLASLSYAYGDGLNLTSVKDSLVPANSMVFAYDAAQRLQTADGPWGRLAYGYTPTGDRLSEVQTPPGGAAVTKAMSYPAGANQLSAVTTGAKVVRSFGYDAAGNLASDNRGADAFAFSYDVRNRPVTVTVTRSGGASETSRYQYNALEQMVSRSTTAAGGPKGTVHSIYGLDGALLAEADGTTGAILRDYIWLPAETPRGPAEEDAAPSLAAPLPLALVTGVNTPSPGLLMVHTDHLGRPIRLTDATRATVWQAVYQPFGEVMSIAGTVEQNLRFPGQYFLLETGLAYNWHRHYDATTGRYTQPDPLRFVDGSSVYGYAGASPVMEVDATGLSEASYRGYLDALSTLGIPHDSYPALPSPALPSPALPSAMCMALPSDWPKTGECSLSELNDCKAQCGSREVLGCYVTIGYTVKGVRGGNIIRSQRRTVNCNCAEE